MVIKFNFHAAAARLGMTKEQLQEYLERLSIYECSDDLPCPEFFVSEGYFVAVETLDEQGWAFNKLFFTEKGILAFEKLLRKEVANGQA